MNWKRVISGVLAAAMLSALPVQLLVSAEGTEAVGQADGWEELTTLESLDESNTFFYSKDDQTFEKITHPEKDVKTADGIVDYLGDGAVAVVTDPEDAATGKSSAALLISSDPEKGFTQIADSDSLFNYPAYHYADSIYGGSIWDMAEFNGRLYVSICTGTEDNMPDDNTMQSFALVRGDQNPDGTFTWTPVAGDQEKDGARYTFGIDPERTRSGAANLIVYNDHLYIGEYNDEEIALERILFAKTGKNADGQFGGGLDCRFINANLEQSVNLYRMDRDENMELVVGNATKMFPSGSLSGLGSGFGRNENQYIWRMQVYDGKLYVGTFDTSSMLECVGQFVNGNLLTRTPAQWKTQWDYLKTLMKALQATDPDGNGNPDTLAQTIKFSYKFVFENITISNIASAIRLLNYMRKAKQGFDLYVSEDGVNFQTITVDGFGDPYNHGLRAFATTDQGLCLGTANPFYGTQVWIKRKDS